MPLPAGQGTGLGKPLKLITHPVRDDIPITVAALGPKSVEMTAELADGWLPIFYLASKAKRALGRGAGGRRDEARPRARAPLEVYAGGAVGIGEGLERLRDGARPMVALYIGGMGAREEELLQRPLRELRLREGGGADPGSLPRRARRPKPPPRSRSPSSTRPRLIGPEGFVKERIAELKESGVNCFNVHFVGSDRAARVKTLEKFRNLIATV